MQLAADGLGGRQFGGRTGERGLEDLSGVEQFGAAVVGVGVEAVGNGQGDVAVAAPGHTDVEGLGGGVVVDQADGVVDGDALALWTVTA